MHTYLTTAAAAEIADVDPKTIREWCRAGKIKAELFGKAWMVDEISLRAHEKDTRGRKRQEAE